MFFKKPQENQPSVNDLALAYMEEKYGEPFTYFAPWGSSYTGTREFLATCQSLPGHTILVQVKDFQGENPVYRDNYLAVKYQEDTAAFFRTEAEKVLGQVNVFYEASKFSLTGALPEEPSFDAFYADKGTVIDVLLELEAAPSREQVETFTAALGESSGQITLTLVAPGAATFGTLSRKELNQLAYRGEADFTAAIRTRGGSFIIDWQED